MINLIHVLQAMSVFKILDIYSLPNNKWIKLTSWSLNICNKQNLAEVANTIM